MAEKSLEQALNWLLEIVGIEIRETFIPDLRTWAVPQCRPTLKKKGFDEIVTCLGKDRAMYAFTDLESLKDDLFKSIQCFCVWRVRPDDIDRGWSWKENPYLGCGSLEEAKIRRDLLETEKDTDS